MRHIAAAIWFAALMVTVAGGAREADDAPPAQQLAPARRTDPPQDGYPEPRLPQAQRETQPQDGGQQDGEPQDDGQEQQQDGGHHAGDTQDHGQEQQPDGGQQAGQPQDAESGERPDLLVPEPDRTPSAPGAAVGGRPAFIVAAVDYDLARENVDNLPRALPELLAYFTEHTEVAVQVRAIRVRLDDERLRQAGLLYLTGYSAILQLSAAEKAGLAKYLRSGGLLFCDDIRPRWGGGGMAGIAGTPFDRQVKALLRDPAVLGPSLGRAWQDVPDGHPIFHSYFQFPNGAPLGGAPGGNVTRLEMIVRDGRPVVIFSDLNISYYWGEPTQRGRERGLQLGCNLIVYAMAQQAMPRR